MNFRKINMDVWDRRECFEHFSTVAKSTYSITVDVDISEFMKFIRENGYRMFPAFIWIVTRAINAREEFRMGYDENGDLGIWDEIYPDYAVIDEETKVMDTLCTPYDKDFMKFYAAIREDMEAYKIEKKRTDSYPNFFIASCIPWIPYSSFTASNESSYTFLFPMVTWGKYCEAAGKVTLPLTLQIHHAVADGYHCGLFFQDVEEMLRRPELYLKK